MIHFLKTRLGFCLHDSVSPCPEVVSLFVFCIRCAFCAATQKNRARSIIDKSRLKDNWSHNWLTIEQLTKFDRSVMAYKIISRQCPESLWDKYHHRTQHSNYRTRNCRDLQIPRNNLEYVKKSFHYSALKAWNDIPINIRELPTLNRFKKQLKCYYTS